MSETSKPAVLELIEKTLADSYKREIDQRENIWRALPFFAATLALQLTALFQVIERLPSGSSWLGIASSALVGLALGCSLGALGFLAASIFPAKFLFLAKDRELLKFAHGLIDDERTASAAAPETAVHLLRENLALQYALASDHNRQINQRRETRRAIAGLLTVFAVGFTLILVAAIFATYLPKYHTTETSDAFPVQAAGAAPSYRDGLKPAAPATPAASNAGGH